MWRKTAKYIRVGALACGVLFTLSCTKSQIGQTMQIIAATATLIKAIVKPFVDPSGTDLANFDVSQFLVNLSSITNATIYSTSGTGTITVTDTSSGTVLGQQSFGWVVQGSSIYAQDPTAVHNWLSQFSNYPSDMTVTVDVEPLLQPIDPTSSTSVTAGSAYQGTTYASSTATYTPNCSPQPCSGGEVWNPDLCRCSFPTQ